MSTMASPISSLTTVYSTVIQAQIKEKNKVPRHWLLWGEFTGDEDKIIPLTKGQSRGKCFNLMTSSWVTPVVLAHTDHPIKNRLKNKSQNLWVRWWFSSWWAYLEFWATSQYIDGLCRYGNFHVKTYWYDTGKTISLYWDGRRMHLKSLKRVLIRDTCIPSMRWYHHCNVSTSTIPPSCSRRPGQTRTGNYTWVGSWMCGCLDTWFYYQMITLGTLRSHARADTLNVLNVQNIDVWLCIIS